MSYAVSPALQKAVYETLAGDVALGALVGTAIFDAPPVGTVPETYVTLGPETVRDRSDGSGGGALHDLAVSVVTAADGFQAAKAVAVAVNDALAAGLPALDRGRLVRLDFLKARARREEAGQIRRIDLSFRARVEDD
ncbi:gene transfer agent protein [Oceanicola sp. 22II-s10i]|uniref:DUF3168 domain-containing protein n=1 Tax=Oceanicola sp. 22II-s10i TaxID=1317116 RepID=UPI000B51F4F1|nr:DUF3168 domain-containing protein [Oceanicola sp. 22II-s10i]OWU85310.1 gene transfer agent protein [Oceanicola sp. 22II-s10i]